MNFLTSGNILKTLLALIVLVSFSCKSSSRYKKPKKAHNHYRSKSKNSWMEEKRRNMQQF